jgi:hypothetical protein
MPTPRITMRRIREVLRLHLEAGLSYAECARVLKLPKSTVGKIVLLASRRRSRLGDGATLSDAELEARLYRPPVPRSSTQLEPDYATSTRSSSAPA